MPDDHRLSVIQGIDSLYDRGYQDILAALSAWKPSSTLIDIGANIGDTAAFFRLHTNNPILCVEGGEHFLSYLRINTPKIDPTGIEVIEGFVGVDSTSRHPLRYRELTGTGMIEFDSGGQTIPFVEIDYVVARARAIGDGEIALIKTDTDGMDGLIVSTILDAGLDAPIYFECDFLITLSFGDAGLWGRIFDRLENDRWSAIFYDNHGRPMGCFDQFPAQLIKDLHGWIHLQHKVGAVHIHYLDIFVFPPAARSVFTEASQNLRERLLTPYAY